MKYREFKNKINNFPVFASSFSGFFEPNAQALRNQISKWKKQGLILQLKRGLYILNENDRKITPSRVFLANQLYAPSYISTEFALMFYDLIPERVVDVTSVTSRKTKNFKNSFGFFVYQHLSAHCFEGFVSQKDENNFAFFIAIPEKAIVDFIYFNLARIELNQADIFKESFRFQNLTALDTSKMLELATLFKNKKLFEVVKMFERLVKQGVIS